MMRSRNNGMPADGSKKTVVALLFVTAGAVSVSGAFFCIYSLACGISFPVFGVQMPGALFGAAVLYLGIRYLIMVFRLKQEVYKPASRFSWDNFRGKKKK